MAYVERVVENLAWDVKGKKAQGRLLGMEVVRFKDGGTNLSYKLKGTNNVIVIFQGATQLNQKLSPADVGCDVSIEYMGEDESRTMTENKNRPKLFKVMVDDSPKQAAKSKPDGLGITDEDISF